MQLSLFYDYERICRSSSFFQKFETLSLAVEAISDEQTLRKGIGRSGYGSICFLKVYHKISRITAFLRRACTSIGFFAVFESIVKTTTYCQHQTMIAFLPGKLYPLISHNSLIFV